MNKIVLLDGRQWTTRSNLMHVVVMWECRRNGTCLKATIPAKDHEGRLWELDVKDIDPVATFNDLIYDRSNPLQSIPPSAA